MVSSFDADILQELQNLNLLNNTDVKCLYLHNYYEYLELPEPDIYTTQGHGINISSTKLTPEVVQICHKHGKSVGVWVNAEVFNEDDNYYMRVMNLGVDIICTDYPLEAIRVRD